MALGLDLGTLLVAAVLTLVVFLLLDLLVAGGGMTGGMMGGMAGIMSTPAGWAVLMLVLIAALLLVMAGR